MHYHVGMPWLLLIVPIFSTLLGGMLALRFRRYVALLTAYSAGLLLGAAFLDILPEALTLGQRAGMSVASLLGYTLLSFLLFYALETGVRALTRRGPLPSGHSMTYRRFGASMLIFHSFRDGMAIGAAFSASHAAGYAVALGIAAHDLGDGMNTIILTTRGESATRADYLFLFADALAPVLGGLLTFWWALSARGSVTVLVLAAGFFLEMATGDFLPELRKEQGSRKVLVPTVLSGVLFIYVANVFLARLGH